MKKLLALVMAIILCACLVACSAPNSDYEAGKAPGDVQASIVNNPLNRKIVYTVYMTLESKDITALKNSINAKNAELGGYIEDSSEDYSDGKCVEAWITYRVPTEKLDEFVNTIEGNGGVESKSISTTDITTSYVDALAEKSALEQRKALLSQMLDDTSISATDRINIINEISKVNTELQSIELLINSYDSDVNYSTVVITVEEAPTFMDYFTPVIIFVLIPIAVLSIVFGSIAISKKRRSAENK